MPRRRPSKAKTRPKARPLLRPLGMQVARLRLERDLTQKWVAKRAGCTYQYLGLIEDARANPTAKILIGLARALDVRVVELFATTPSPEGIPPAGAVEPPAPQRRRASRRPR